jgi:hypothetical protein
MPVRTLPNAPGGGGLSKIQNSTDVTFPVSGKPKSCHFNIFKSNLVESFESFLFCGLLPFQNTTGRLFPNGDYSVSKSPHYVSLVSNLGFQIIFFLSLFFHQETISKITEATTESTLFEAILR